MWTHTVVKEDGAPHRLDPGGREETPMPGSGWTASGLAMAEPRGANLAPCTRPSTTDNRRSTCMCGFVCCNERAATIDRNE